MMHARKSRIALTTLVAASLALGMTPPAAVASPASPSAAIRLIESAKTSRPAIVTQPVRTYVARGGTATFRVSAKGSGLKYQWYRNYQPFARGLSAGGSSYKPVWRAIDGATRSSYSVSGAIRFHSSQYRVVVSNSAGKVTSSSATLLVGNRYLNGPYITPTRPSGKPFRPGEVAFVDEWAVAIQPTRRVKASETTDRVTVTIGAYSGYITSWMWDWVKTKPTSALAVTVVSRTDDDDRTHRAKLSGLKGEWSRGFTFTATVTVPRGWTLETWTISHNGREQYFSSQTG